MKVSYFPGCTLRTKAKDLDFYARKCAELLGVELCEIPDWQCCGGVFITAKDEIASKLSSVRALAAARYEGETAVYHYLELLRDVVGFDKLAQAVVHPLTGRKIAAYYGCLLLRPGKVMAFDDVENPQIIENFLRALGAEPVLYPRRNECCGGYVALEDAESARKKSSAVIDSAAAHGAELIVTACPLCKYNLEKQASTVPVVYFTELLAEALGVKENTHAE